MLRAIGSVLNEGLRETAKLTVTTVVSTGIAVGTYKGASSTYNFFNKQLDEFSKKSTEIEPLKNGTVFKP